MQRLIVSAILASAAIAAPASAVTFVFGGATANVASVNLTSEGVTLSATARKFTATPGALTNLSQTAASGQISVTAPGIGVAGGASAPQIDTNQTGNREAVLLTSSRKITIEGLRLSYIDSNDTLQIYGVNADGSLVNLGFGGLINTGLGGAASFTNSAANSGTTNLTFNSPTAAFDRYLFTTRVGGEQLFGGTTGQGYRLDRLVAGVVPEPATWAMLIAGFGLVGVSLRRRRPLEA